MANIQPLKAQIRAGFLSISANDVRNIRVPALLISGEKSNAMLRAVTDKLEELLPDVERVNNTFIVHPLCATKALALAAFSQIVVALSKIRQ